MDTETDVFPNAFYGLVEDTSEAVLGLPVVPSGMTTGNSIPRAVKREIRKMLALSLSAEIVIALPNDRWDRSLGSDCTGATNSTPARA